jgi:protein PhnA
MSQTPPFPNCPSCNSEYTYPDGDIYVCPECAHEWKQIAQTVNDERIIKDSNGVILNDGDTVTVIKDLKIKGSSSVIKVGTKVKKIRLTDGIDGHDINCKIDGFGMMVLKSKMVKKV